MLRCRQITSSRISAVGRLAFIAPETVSSVDGARSWPRSIRPTSSSTTAAASRTSPSSPSSVRTFPRRWTSHPILPSSSRRTASSEPASSAATVLSSVSCLRAKLLLQSGADRVADPPAVGAPVHLRHREAHHLARVLGARCAGLLDRLVHELRELVVRELGRQIGLDQLGLALLGRGALLAATVAIGARRLQSPPALAPERRHLVSLALLCLLLKRVCDEAQRADPVALTGLHRLPRIRLNSLQDAHGYRVAGGRRIPIRHSAELDVLDLAERHLQEARAELAKGLDVARAQEPILALGGSRSGDAVAFEEALGRRGERVSGGDEAHVAAQHPLEHW